MSALDNYRIQAWKSLHQDSGYSSECQVSKEENFRRARSCDNILDGEWGGTGWGNKRKEELRGVQIGSTTNKERLINVNIQ